MKSLTILLLMTPFWSISQTIFEDFDKFLIKHSVFGSIDYGSVKENPSFLKEIVRQIAIHDLSESTENHKKAFYINSYNILVISQVTENYPIKSPLDVDGFFKKNRFTVAGELLTLDQIEFEKLLGISKDPRIHFSLSCAARGCPYLDEHAFFPNNLEKKLNNRSKLIIDQPNYVNVDYSNRKVQVCKIFEWYEDQFLETSETLIDFINKYRNDKIPSTYSIEFMKYDWSLNDR